jgi:hypothetical protein
MATQYGDDGQVLVTHANRMTIIEREMGHPTRIIRGPDLCDLVQGRDEERLPGPVERWESSGIGAQGVQIPPTGGPLTHDRHPTPSSCQAQAGRDPSTPTTGLIRQTGPRMAPPAIGETICVRPPTMSTRDTTRPHPPDRCTGV